MTEKLELTYIRKDISHVKKLHKKMKTNVFIIFEFNIILFG